MPMIQNVKPIQMQELQTEFDKLDLNGADKPRQTRFLRSQQNAKQKQEQAAASGGGGAAAASVVVDEADADGLYNDRIGFMFMNSLNKI